MIRFTKMEGLGNDYLYINNLAEQIPVDRLPELARRMSERHFGVGSDGIILVDHADEPGHDFRFRMYNADGSESEMCGNGMRCFARYCYDRGLTTKTELTVQTGAGTIRPKLILDEAGAVAAVRVDMGAPRFKAAEIPVGAGDSEAEAMAEVVALPSGECFTGACVSMGNPHFTIWVDDVDTFDLERIGPLLERHERFPRRINVHIVQKVCEDELKMRTWERGSGITLACGTGAAAVHVTALRQGVVGRTSTIHLPGGPLQLEWDEATHHVFKTGPARFICDGVWLG